MVAEIEAEAKMHNEELGTEPLGMEKIRRLSPFSRPAQSSRSPKPLCHAASKEMRERVRRAYRAFVVMFREASLKVRLGLAAEAIFPKGSFPPNLPFVRTGDELDPLADAGGSRGFAAALAAMA